MLAFEPFRLVFHLGQDKGGRHGSQSFRRIQNRNVSPLSGDIEIGLIFSRSSLGHQSRGKGGAAWPVYLVEPDLGKSFLKLADSEPGIVDDIDGDLAFCLRRLKRFVPLALPRLCRSASLARDSEKQGDGQTNKESSSCTQTNHRSVRHGRMANPLHQMSRKKERTLVLEVPIVAKSLS